MNPARIAATIILAVFAFFAAVYLTGCTMESRAKWRAFGGVAFGIAQKVAVDEFNLWLEEQ